MTETVREKHKRLYKEHKRKLETIATEIISSLPNLEEDEKFDRYKEHIGQGAWHVARDEAREAQNLDYFKRVEISYSDGGFRQEMIYAIGYGKLETPTIGTSEGAIFYLKEWSDDSDIRDRDVRTMPFEKLESFKLLED